jgi:hypothetical protein
MQEHMAGHTSWHEAGGTRGAHLHKAGHKAAAQGGAHTHKAEKNTRSFPGLSR